MPAPQIDTAKCNSCKACMEVCAMGVFAEEEGKVVVKKAKDCIGCRACEMQCPKQAIKVSD